MILTDWIRWLWSTPPDQLAWYLLPLLLIDAPRYALGAFVVWVCDATADLARRICGSPHDDVYAHCPSVCVVIAGLDEADTLPHTMDSLLGTYPRMEIVIVDDGSTDEMSEIAQRYAREHSGILALRKPNRGGKSSALNFALPFTCAEIVVCVDGDSHVSPTAVWEVVQPFADPEVGAVSATVVARNPFDRLVTWLQALEYRRNIFLGRMLAGRLGILGIISGAFGAYRRDAIQRLQGWDVGPGEDGDLTLRLRKAGYQVVFAPYAQCMTNLPTTWKRLLLQRRRWEWAVVTFECRKHIDLANIRSPNFRWSNLLLLLDRWMFNVILLYVFWIYSVWLCFHVPHQLSYVLLLNYLAYLALDTLQLLIILYYSTDPWRDLKLGILTPLMPFYHLVMRAVSLWAVTEEILTRRSFRDGFVPAHVRQTTWHW